MIRAREVTIGSAIVSLAFLGLMLAGAIIVLAFVVKSQNERMNALSKELIACEKQSARHAQATENAHREFERQFVVLGAKKTPHATTR